VHANGRAYLVLEYLQGKTLTDALIEMGAIGDMGSLADIAWQLATMLGAAHNEAIVHGALKPDGIFLTFPPQQAPRPLVKLLDFGMAKFTLNVRHSQTGSLLGAPLYMSPEIARGVGKVDHRADVYSLGCIMFEMACGRPPFVRAGKGELIIAHMTEPAPFVSSLEPSIPQGIDTLIGRMLTKNPAVRPQTMAEVASVLAKFFACPLPEGSPPIPPRASAQVAVSAPPSAPVPARAAIADAQPAFSRPMATPFAVSAMAAAESAAGQSENRGQQASIQTPAVKLPPRKQDPTAFFQPPGEKGPLAQATAGSKSPTEQPWAVRVQQKTAFIAPPLKTKPPIEPKARPSVSWPSQRSRPSSIKIRRSQAGLASKPAPARHALASAINIPVVVITSSVLLILALVLYALLSRKSETPTPQRAPLTPTPTAEFAPPLPKPPTSPPTQSIGESSQPVDGFRNNRPDLDPRHEMTAKPDSGKPRTKKHR
jgi:serine/threonine protein kinase